MKNKRPTIGIGVFVWKDGKFLMGLRIGAHGSNTWSIPGGHLEYGESWEEGAAREAQEETGMKIGNIRFTALTNDIFKKDDKHSVTIWVESDWISSEAQIMEPDKLIQFKWLDFKSLPSPLFEPCWKNLKAERPDLFK